MSADRPDNEGRIFVPCPRCGERVSLPMVVTPKLIQTVSYEAFLTAEVAFGGVTHRCMEPSA